MKADESQGRLRLLTPMEIGWLAGIVEGEGSITWQNKTSVALRVSMTDRDVVERLLTLTGVGTFREIPPRRDVCKTQWAWNVNKCDDVEFILTTIRPLMGERRGARIDAALERLLGNPGRGASKREVKHGTLAGATWHWRHGEKACPSCRKAKSDWQREHRRKTGYWKQYAARKRAA